jgi:Putative MetA-pathway of phenol degradation
VATVAYRYFHSFRDFNANGDEVNIPLIKNDTYVDLFDISATYAATKRVSLTLELPIQYGSRTNAAEHDGVHVHTMRASGIGDMRLSANVWLLNPDKHLGQNISLSLGVKAPTGDDSVTDTSFRPTGPEQRPVDPAIQPGDGGWGIILSGSAFAKIYKRTFFYLNAFYLINPRETNGVHTVNFDVPPFTHGDHGLMVNSVPDQSMVRGGLAGAIWPKIGLSASFGARWEGIPAHDLIGGSDGWRLPGYSVSVEPGISISHGKDFFEVTAPVAVYRYGIVSVPFARIHSPLGGIASFSDFQINVTYSHVF